MLEVVERTRHEKEGREKEREIDRAEKGDECEKRGKGKKEMRGMEARGKDRKGG